jgi:hypothetical protein
MQTLLVYGIDEINLITTSDTSQSKSNNSIGQQHHISNVTSTGTSDDGSDKRHGVNQTILISDSKHSKNYENVNNVNLKLNSSDDGGNSTIEGHPVVKLPSNTLLKYTAYKDVAILHFRIPSDTRTALYVFKAFEETKSAFRK